MRSFLYFLVVLLTLLAAPSPWHREAAATPTCYVWVSIPCDQPTLGGCSDVLCHFLGTTSTPIDMDGDGFPDYDLIENKYKCEVEFTDPMTMMTSWVRPYGYYGALGFYYDCWEQGAAELAQSMGYLWIESWGYTNDPQRADLDNDGDIEGDWENGITYCWQRTQCPTSCTEIDQSPPKARCNDGFSQDWENDPASKVDAHVCTDNGSGDCWGYWWYMGW